MSQQHQDLFSLILRSGETFKIKDLILTSDFPFKGSQNTRVCKCTDSNNEEYVVKVIKKDPTIVDLYDYQSGDLKHAQTTETFFDSSVLTYEIAEEMDDLIVIVSKYRGFNLAEYRQKKENQSLLLLCEILQILTRVSNALNLLHSKQIIHRDIKPENIFVSMSSTDCSIPFLSVTLGDLGIARSISDTTARSIGATQCYKLEENINLDLDNCCNNETEDEMYEICENESNESTLFCGTSGYIAPECLLRKRQCYESDVWSLGRSILLLLFPLGKASLVCQHLDECTKLVKTEDLNDDNCIRKLIEKGDLEEDVNGWRQFLELIKRMLDDNPEKRPSCHKILQRIFPGGEIHGLSTIPNQFHILDQQFSNRNVQLFSASFGVDIRLLDKMDREIVLHALKQKGLSLEFTQAFKKDREIVMQAVKEKGRALKFADDSLKTDREIVETAIGRGGRALKYAARSFKKEKDLVLRAVKQNGWSLEFAHESLKKDKDVVEQAINQYGRALKYANKTLKKDRDIVKKAVEQNGFALKYANKSLKKDREIVLQAVKKKGCSLEFAHESLKQDREIVIQAVMQDNSAIKFVDEPLKEEILQAVSTNEEIGQSEHNNKSNPKAWLSKAPSFERKDKKIVLKAISDCAENMLFADNLFKKGREFILEAVKQNGNALAYVYKEFRSDREIVMQAVMQAGQALEHADRSLKIDREIVMQAVKQDGRALKFADDSFRKDREIVYQSVSKKGFALEYADNLFKEDREIVMQAIKQNIKAFKYVGRSLKRDEEIISLVKREKIKQNTTQEQ